MFSELFEYDETSPSFLRWKVSRGKAKVGSCAGSVKGNGYYQVGYKGKYIGVHRVIWSLFNGDIPSGYLIDHKDHNPLNNNIDNLRLITSKGNNTNRLKTNNVKTSTYKGVGWNKRAEKWRVLIYNDYKQHFVGYFSDEEEAARAYDTKAKELFGEYAGGLNFG